jgi:hypothetical protein
VFEGDIQLQALIISMADTCQGRTQAQIQIDSPKNILATNPMFDMCLGPLGRSMTLCRTLHNYIIPSYFFLLNVSSCVNYRAHALDKWVASHIMFGGILIGFLILSSIEIKGGKDPHYNPFPSSIRQKKKKN